MKERNQKTYQHKGTKDEGEYTLTDITFILTKFLKSHISNRNKCHRIADNDLKTTVVS